MNSVETSWNFPAYAAQVIARLSGGGYQAYFVGGCVRDMLLGRPIYDYDICTDALPQEVKALFPHTADTGIQNGTVTVLADGGAVEVTTFRCDGAYRDHRHPASVVFTKNLADDLQRRDFTVNALCYHPASGLLDLVGGLADLEQGQIRAIGRAEVRFKEDALRMLRALRFRCTLGFSIEEETDRAIRACAPLIQHISQERVQTEVDRILLSPRPADVFSVAEYGLAPFLHPMLPQILQAAQGRETALASVPASLPLRLAVLMLGFPEQQARVVLTELRYPGRTIAQVCRTLEAAQSGLPSGKVPLKQLLRSHGRQAVLGAIAVLDACGEDGAQAAREMLDGIERGGECYCLSDLAIRGSDLTALGLKGEQVGAALNALLDRVITHPEQNCREKLLEAAKNKL